MKVYSFELKKQFANTLVWMIVLLGVLWLMLNGFYPIFLDSKPEIEAMVSAFPEGFAAAFGFDVDDLFSYESFSGMVYLYEGILAAIMASGAAIAVFAREKQSKCVDFIMTKPLRRSEVFAQKLLCCLTVIAAVNIPYLILFSVDYMKFNNGNGPTKQMALSMLCLFFTQLVFLSFGIFAAVILRRIRSASALGVGIGMFAFLLSIVYSLTEKEIFKYISPLYYFSPNAVAEAGSYDIPCVLTAVALTVGLTAAAYLIYTKADIAAQ